MMPSHQVIEYHAVPATPSWTSTERVRLPKTGAMSLLIHARLRTVFETIRVSLEQRQHRVDGAFTVEEGADKMRQGRYDRIFIDIGVPNEDRLSLMAMAGELRVSMVEIIDRDTVERELLRGKSVGLPHPLRM